MRFIHCSPSPTPLHAQLGLALRRRKAVGADVVSVNFAEDRPRANANVVVRTAELWQADAPDGVGRRVDRCDEGGSCLIKSDVEEAGLRRHSDLGPCRVARLWLQLPGGEGWRQRRQPDEAADDGGRGGGCPPEMGILFGLARRTARKSRKNHYFTGDSTRG